MNRVVASMDYRFTETEKFSDIAQRFGTTVDILMKLNGINPPYPVYIRDLPVEKVQSFKSVLKVPCVTNGRDSFESYYKKAYDTIGVQYRSSEELVRISNELAANSSPGSVNINYRDISPGRHGMDCYIRINRAGQTSLFYFPCYPESVSDSNSASYSAVSILGRSEPFQYYTGSGPRTVSVSFEMHCEMCGDIDYVYNLVSNIESACYPNYGNAVSATKVTFHVANNINITGIISSVDTDYSGPILYTDLDPYSGRTYPRYAVVKINFSVTECTGNSFSSSQIAQLGGMR